MGDQGVHLHSLYKVGGVKVHPLYKTLFSTPVWRLAVKSPPWTEEPQKTKEAEGEQYTKLLLLVWKNKQTLKMLVLLMLIIRSAFLLPGSRRWCGLWRIHWLVEDPLKPYYATWPATWPVQCMQQSFLRWRPIPDNSNMQLSTLSLSLVSYFLA